MDRRHNKASGPLQHALPEEKALLFKAAAGDQQAVEQLLRQYKGLVRRKAGSMYMAGADSEDVIQEGMIGLFQAIRDYQPDLDVPFAAFAAFCISARITDAVRRASRLKHQPLNDSLSLQTLNQTQDSGQQLLDWFADQNSPNPEMVLLERENLHDLQYFIQNKLSELERQVVLCYLESTQYDDIARQMHCSVKTVDNALRRARKKFLQYRSNRRKTRRDRSGEII